MYKQIHNPQGHEDYTTSTSGPHFFEPQYLEIPEPGADLLLALALVCLAIFRRLRK